MTSKELKWHKRYMNLAKEIAKWSSCLKRNVGAVITVDNRIVSAGYNGAPPNIPSCIETKHCLREKCKSGECLEECIAIHAEQNAITSAAKFGISIKNGTIYTTTFPCASCMKIIIAAGITTIVYNEDYNSQLSHKLAKESGLTLYKI